LRLRNLLDMDLLTTARCRFSPNVEVDLTAYRRATVRVRPTGRITGGGQLQVGFKWPAFLRERTLLAVWDRACLTVKNKFVMFSGSRVIVDPDAHLEIDFAQMNSHASIACFNHIKMGNDVFIGENVTIRDSDNHKISDATRPVSEPIIIGDHVWIGINAILLKGANIGSGSIIAAGSLVTKSIPPNALAAGIPAKVIREGVQWEE
jgi:acetyltransferase-like isoleucine patch superfamily enzyme